jgi:competence protein ComEC
MEQAQFARFAHSPLLIIAIAMSAGILTGNYFFGQARPGWAVSAALSLACGLFSFSLVVKRPFKFPEKRLTIATALLIAAFLFAGFSLFSIGAPGPAANQISRLCDQGAIRPGEPVELTGIIKGEPEPAPYSFYLTLKVERVRVKGSERDASGTVLLLARTGLQQVKTEYDSLELRHGARIRVMTTLARENNFRNPGVLPFTEYLNRKGYDATGLIKSPLLIERLDDERVFLPLAWLYQWRARLQKEFSGTFSPDTAGVLNAALLGNPYNISQPTAERFRNGGTFHILVISGLQIAFIAGFVFLIVQRFTRLKILQFAFATLLLWGYTVTVGGEASVTRAALMFTIASFASLVARQPNSLNMIAGAGIVLLVWKPSDLFDPSFQLTFLSVLAIVCLSVPILQNMQRVGSWRPTMVTPYPPECARWFRVLSESLFWSERAWKADLAASNIQYRLFKTCLAARFERWRIQKLLRFAVAAVVVSASVQVGLLPAMILYFHRISIASLALNIFVGALMAVLAFAALAAILLSHISAWLATPLIAVTEKVDWLMVHSVDPFSRLGAASVRVPHYSGWGASIYVLYFMLLGFLILSLARWNPLRPAVNTKRSRIFPKRALLAARAAFGIVLLMIVLHPASSAKPDGKLHVDFLDVGQGDSALLTTPEGTTVLIDGGGRPAIGWKSGEQDEDEDAFERDTRSIGERVVSEYLWSRGLDRVDYVIATHADADHIDGLNSVALNFGVRSAIVARTPASDPEFAKLTETLKRTGISVETIGAGDVMRIGSVTLEVVWPPPTSNPGTSSRNNDSVVLRARMGEKTFLFTGDIEKEAEASLLSLGINLHSDVVKVAHHGSKTSSTEAFVRATRPSLAIISVGRTSIFGHPHKDVVERWKASGAVVMTTGERGMISIVTDGRGLSVRTFVRE